MCTPCLNGFDTCENQTWPPEYLQNERSPISGESYRFSEADSQMMGYPKSAQFDFRPSPNTIEISLPTVRGRSIR